MTTKVEKFPEVRAKFRIPEHYGRGLQMPDGSIHFDYCDSTISVRPDGTATETHMGLGVSGHEFITTPWRAKGETK